jgi:3-isopropylmalate/(R)-2-methylmalate dehydratase large subunit
MGATLAEKILARAAGRAQVTPGEIVWAKVDLAMATDSSGPRRLAPQLERLGVGLWDPERVVIVADHFAMPNDAREAEIQQETRAFAHRYGVRKFHELEGICHLVVIERGYVAPGMLYVGADSHSCTAGVMGALAIPVGSTDMLGVWVTGEIWLTVPETIRVEWRGRLPEGVMAKDLVLHLLPQLDPDWTAYRVVEFGGEALAALPLDERMVFPNMAAEMGAKTGILPPDDVVFAHLERLGRRDYQPVYSDPDAAFARVLTIAAETCAPLVAQPPAPDRVAPASALTDVRLDQAYIGACTGAKLYDLEQAARVLRGRHKAPGVRLLVAPASAEVYRRAAANGVLETLVAAGATLLPSACGACAGLGLGVLGPGEVCISSTNRNFPGRMGHRDAQVYLANPMTVAASAVTGHITDPRELL